MSTESDVLKQIKIYLLTRGIYASVSEATLETEFDEARPARITIDGELTYEDVAFIAMVVRNFTSREPIG